MDDRAQKGLILKKAREAKGITLEMVQDATKIPLDSLKAIEEGYRVRTLTDFYYRAFMKMYAKYLGLDIAAILEDYKPEQFPRAEKSQKEKGSWRPKPSSFVNKQVLRTVVKAALFFIVLLLCFRMGSCWFKSRASVPTKPKTESKKADTSRSEKFKFFSKRTPADKPKTTRTPETSSPAPAAFKPSHKKIHLTVRTKKETWISVRVDGVVMSRTSFKKGSVESWTALESIELSGKNLNNLEFELNGQPTNPFGKTHRSIKKILINQDGFKIED